MSEHFHRSLSESTARQSTFTAVLKWRVKAKVKVSLHDGGSTWTSSGEAIIIRRVDIQKVHDYARANACLRDYLLIRLPMQIGLRVTEISTLKIEDIDFDTRSFQVLDCKKKQYYPLPLDMLTLQLIQDLVKPRIKGYVFRRIGNRSWKYKREGKPLSRATIWQRIHDLGLAAGVPNFHPHLLRHYCAHYLHKVKKVPVDMMQRILRHKRPGQTVVYLARLSFFEDDQEVYERIQNPHQISLQQQTPDVLPSFYKEWCSHCQHEPICKIIDQMCASPGALGCRYYKKKELTQKIG